MNIFSRIEGSTDELLSSLKEIKKLEKLEKSDIKKAISHEKKKLKLEELFLKQSSHEKQAYELEKQRCKDTRTAQDVFEGIVRNHGCVLFDDKFWVELRKARPDFFNVTNKIRKKKEETTSRIKRLDHKLINDLVEIKTGLRRLQKIRSELRAAVDKLETGSNTSEKKRLILDSQMFLEELDKEFAKVGEVLHYLSKQESSEEDVEPDDEEIKRMKIKISSIIIDDCKYLVKEFNVIIGEIKKLSKEAKTISYTNRCGKYLVLITRKSLDNLLTDNVRKEKLVEEFEEFIHYGECLLKKKIESNKQRKLLYGIYVRIALPDGWRLIFRIDKGHIVNIVCFGNHKFYERISRLISAGRAPDSFEECNIFPE